MSVMSVPTVTMPCWSSLRILRALVAGERDPAPLAAYSDPRCKAPAETLRAALVGNSREEHVFALAQALELYDARGPACDPRRRPDPDRRDRPVPGAHAGGRVRDGPLGLAERQALHLLADPGAAQQNLWRQGAVGAHPALRQPGRGAAAAGGGGGWAHRAGPGGLLPPSGGAGGQGQGGHRDGAQDRRSLLQHAPPRHGLRRSGRLRLRGTLPAAGPEQSPTPGQVTRIRLAEGRPCLSCNSCFLGTRTYLVSPTIAPQLLAEQDRAGDTCPVCLEHVLGQIQSDRANFCHGRLPSSGGQHHHFGTSMPSGGVHSITEIVPVYDRSQLIEAAIETLKGTLIEESAIVALVCIVFLLHLRSALVAILMLPVGILMSFAAMKLLGLGSNIMSLGGIAIAVGAMIDAAIVMIENAH